MGGYSTVSTLPPGSRLHDRYEIERVIGQGGVGIVYLAYDRELDGEPRAIKTIRPELLLDPRGARCIRDEAIAAQRLSHPNIVRYFHYDEWNGISYVVLEYVSGKTLADLLAEKESLSWEEFLSVSRHLCVGLSYAHEQGVIHQDIKPSNIFIGDDGTTKLADFGIARVAKDATTRLTGQMPPGTLLYMSPEALRGEHPKAASDIYSLGIVFYEMLTGNPPFVRGDIFRQHQEIEPRPIGGIDSNQNRVIMRGLEKDPADRPASVQEYWRDISAEAADTEPLGGRYGSRPENGQTKSKGSRWDNTFERFGEKMESFGDRVEEWGKQFEERFEHKKHGPTPFGTAEAEESSRQQRGERARWNRLEGGIFLIVIGLIFFLQRFGGRLAHFFSWGLIWPVFIIIAGIFYFLKPKKNKP